MITSTHSSFKNYITVEWIIKQASQLKGRNEMPEAILTCNYNIFYVYFHKTVF